MSSSFHGLLLINKEPGGTSHDVVAQVRRIMNTRSVGHAGTLDPLAGGLMVLLVGEGTKLSNYILEGNKSYRGQCKLGFSTTTLDMTGEVLEQKPVNVTAEQILAAAAELVGEFEWEVPLFSAIKVQGKALHKYAREGEDVVRPMKKMKFWDVSVRVISPDTVEVDMTCIKGSYVRSWFQKLGEKLGCGAAMSALTRTGSDPYRLEQAVTLGELSRLRAAGEESAAFVDMDNALPMIRKVRVQGPDQALLLNGQISHGLRSLLITQARPGVQDLVQVHSIGNQLLALVGLEQDRGFAIKRVFRYDGE